MTDQQGDGRNKIKEVEKELDATKNKMQENIGKLLERGEKIEALETKAERLQDDAEIFRSRAKKLRCHFLIQYWKMISVIMLILLIIIIILVFTLKPDDDEDK